MPRIQEYRQQSRGGVSAPTGQMQASGVSGLAESLKIVGKTVDNISNEYDKYKEKQADFNSEKIVTDAGIALTEDFENEKKNVQGNGKGFTDSWISKLEKRKEDILSNEELSSREKELINLKYSNIANRSTRESIAFEADYTSSYSINETKNTNDKLVNQVRGNPALLDSHAEAAIKLVDSNPLIDSSVKNKLRSEVTKDVYGAAIDGSITKLEQNGNTSQGQINALQNELKKDKWTSNLDQKDYDRALNRLGSMKTTLQARDQIAFKEGFQSSMEKIRSTGIDDGKFTKADIMNSGLPEKQKQSMLEIESKSRMIGAEIAKISNSPIDEVMQSISYDKVQAELKNAKPEDFSKIQDTVDARISAVKERQAIYKKDPVRYVMASSPLVAAKYQNLIQNPTPETVQDYAETLKTEQNRLDPYSVPKLQTVEDINRVKYMMDSAAPDNAGAREKLNTLKTLNETWGKHYPDVVRDLRNAKALTSIEYVAANVGASNDRISMAEDLIKASNIPDSEYKKILPLGKTESDISKRVKSSLEPFRQSLAYSIDGTEMYGDYVEAGEKLSMYYASKGRKVDEQQIVRDMILKDYEFIDNYRIPKAKVNDPSTVKTGARNILMDIDYLELAPLKNQSGIKDEDTVSYYKTRLKTHGKLVNDSDNGLRLIDERGYQVYGIENGKRKPLTWTWQELSNRKSIRSNKLNNKSNLGAKI